MLIIVQRGLFGGNLRLSRRHGALLGRQVKVRPFPIPFPIVSLRKVAQSLVRQKSQEKHLYVNWVLVYCIKIIFQLRGAPGRKDASSQDCCHARTWEEKNAEQAFLLSSWQLFMKKLP